MIIETAKGLYVFSSENLDIMTDVCLSRSYVGVCGCVERDGGVRAFTLFVWGEFSRRYSTLGGAENSVASGN